MRCQQREPATIKVRHCWHTHAMADRLTEQSSKQVSSGCVPCTNGAAAVRQPCAMSDLGSIHPIGKAEELQQPDTRQLLQISNP